MATLLPATASATTSVTADLGTVERPVTHVASGSLYGMVENRPADLEELLAPLSPKMFTNPAANIQQPHGDAMAVAARVAPYGATVTIRLADLFPNWPYSFTTIEDYLDRIEDTVQRKQESGLDNYYGYEIWNEPDLTWTGGTGLFNDMWIAVHDKLRELDPDVPIIGASWTEYNENEVRGFLTFARDNDVLPDIISWHQLLRQDITSDIAEYRAIEEELGVGPLLISINEYSDEGWVEDEGEPGASAPLIAKFERLGVDTACISYWDVPNPGRLGSLLANNTQRNGGWWLYKWYGDMSGDMVATFAPDPHNAAMLDGFANLDKTERWASIVAGGHNDGTIEIVVEGFAESGIFGTTADVLVEHVSWEGRYTPVETTDVLESGIRMIENDQIVVTIPDANDVDGYHVVLSPTDDAPMGTGGANSGGTGGMDAMGTGGTGTGIGGANTGGGLATGGAGIGGSLATGGVSTGGNLGTGGTSVASGGTLATGDDSSAASEDVGCGCRMDGRKGGPSWPTWMFLALPLLVRRFRGGRVS